MLIARALPPRTPTGRSCAVPGAAEGAGGDAPREDEPLPCPTKGSFRCAALRARGPPGPAGAAHRSAARAGVARPDPFRTRKLRPLAPMVLRGEPVGEQGAADRWTAPGRPTEALKRGPPGPLSRIPGPCGSRGAGPAGGDWKAICLIPITLLGG